MSDAPAPAPLVTARALHKTYVVGKRTLEVLRGIDLTVRRGEFLALRGASGAGKSTLLHLLGGLDLPNAGEIRFDGTDLRALSAGALAQWRKRAIDFAMAGVMLAGGVAGSLGLVGAADSVRPG